MVGGVVMGIVKEYFYNIECDVCGSLYDEESWKADPECLSEELEENGWVNLGGKDYCPMCWTHHNNVILTSDGKVWDCETDKEIIDY